jgi:colicin import membrane protein
MSTLTTPERPITPGSQEDPFRIGWRDVVRTLPDGRTEIDQIPLTLEDALHPEFGDVLLENDEHDIIRSYLAWVFRERLADNPNALVLSDVGIYWDNPDLRHHAPDVSVIFDVRSRPMMWKSFHVEKEGTRPRLLIEIVTPSTRKNDVETKFEQYHQAGVPLYVLLDRKDEKNEFELRGYQNTPDGYLPMPMDSRGRLWLEPVGLWLSKKDRRVVCVDGKTGQEVGDYVAISRKLASTSAELDAAARQLGEEQQKAAAETLRAEAERQRAEAERQRAEAAESRLREMEAELARLRPNP